MRVLTSLLNSRLVAAQVGRHSNSSQPPPTTQVSAHASTRSLAQRGCGGLAPALAGHDNNSTADRRRQRLPQPDPQPSTGAFARCHCLCPRHGACAAGSDGWLALSEHRRTCRWPHQRWMTTTTTCRRRRSPLPQAPA